MRLSSAGTMARTVAAFPSAQSMDVVKRSGPPPLGEAIESNLACGRHLELLVKASDDFEMVAPVEFSIFCFRHVPGSSNESPQAIDTFNERLLIALQRDGSSYLSNATLGGRFALRVVC